MAGYRSAWNLQWSEVDPVIQPFEVDPELRRDLEAAVRSNAAGLLARSERWLSEGQKAIESKLFSSVMDVLVARFGDWASGWSWSHDGGGVVASFCCTGHSFFVDGYDESAVSSTADLILTSLGEWRQFLTTLRSHFEHMAATSGAADLAESWPELVSVVEDKTETSDAWYYLSELALQWFFEFRGFDVDIAKSISAAVHAEGFESWVPMEPDNMIRAAERLRVSVVQSLGYET